MKVKATETGYFGQIRETGDVFEVPDDAVLKDAWFVQVDEPAAPAPARTRRGAAAGPAADEPDSI